MVVYQNQFTGILRKYIKDKGFDSIDGGSTWVSGGMPEELIKKLPYYKVLK